MLDEVLQLDRRLRMAHAAILRRLDPDDRALMSSVERYINSYAMHYQLSAADTVAGYNDFCEAYARHVLLFRETRRYPVELGDGYAPGRIAYDLALMLSIVAAPHRFAIMRELHNASIADGKTLIIGVGSGVELTALRSRAAVDAYDVSLVEFPQIANPGVNFYHAQYSGEPADYDCVIAIELLEHTADPYALIANCQQALRPDGVFLFTTATNIPQFDHLYNFVDDFGFEANLAALGFSVARKVPIPHESCFVDIGSRNTFYVCRKL